MAQTTVVVTFSSLCGATETLALAAAVGAVQGRALIRLRRLPDGDAPLAVAAPVECQDTLKRMRKEYVAPTETDILGADALILAPRAGALVSSEGWSEFFSMLMKLAPEARLVGKVGAIVDAGNDSTLTSFAVALLRAGFTIVPAGPEDVTGHGRTVAKVARLLHS